MQSVYDQTSEHYDDRYWDIQIHKYSAFEKDFIRDKSPLIIDSGGGTGLLARYLKREIVILDLSIGMLKVSQRNYSSVHLIAADGENLPLRKESSDLVTSFSMVQNLPSPQKGVREIVRCSSLKGIITSLARVLGREKLMDSLNECNVEYESVELSLEDVGFRFRLLPQTHSHRSQELP